MLKGGHLKRGHLQYAVGGQHFSCIFKVGTDHKVKRSLSSIVIHQRICTFHSRLQEHANVFLVGRDFCCLLFCCQAFIANCLLPTANSTDSAFCARLIFRSQGDLSPRFVAFVLLAAVVLFVGYHCRRCHVPIQKKIIKGGCFAAVGHR